MTDAAIGHDRRGDDYAYAAAQGHASALKGRIFPAAADDDNAYTELMGRLADAQRRATMRYLMAVIVSLGWFGLVAGYFAASGVDISQPVANGDSALLLVLAGAPCLLALATAALMNRLGQSDAYILALCRATDAFMQPDPRAAEQIVSVSQAVRREVAALSDGIERAFSRTSELEAVVRNEIIRLERAFSDNERRVGGLLRQLETERAAVVRHAESLKTALPLLQATASPASSALDPAAMEAHRSRLLSALQTDADRLSQEVVSAVAESAGQVLDALRIESEKAISAVTDAALRLEQSLPGVAAPVGEGVSGAVLEAFAREATEAIAEEVRDAIAALGEEMSAKAQELGGLRAGLAAVLDRSRHEFTRVLAQTSREASSEIAAAHREARASLQNEIAEMTSALSAARPEGPAALSDGSVAAEIAALRQLLEDNEEGRLEEIRARLAEHASRIETLVAGSVTQVNEGIAERLKSLQTMLFDQENGLAGQFEQGHGQVVERLQEVSESIDELVQNSLSQAQATAEQLSSLVDTLGLVARARRESPAREGAAYIARENQAAGAKRLKAAQGSDSRALAQDEPQSAQSERAPVWLSELLTRGPKA